MISTCWRDRIKTKSPNPRNLFTKGVKKENTFIVKLELRHNVLHIRGNPPIECKSTKESHFIKNYFFRERGMEGREMHPSVASYIPSTGDLV